MEQLHRIRDSDQLTVNIAEAIATRVGSAPENLKTPLYDVVDVEALEKLLHSNSHARVSFEYEGYHVEVDGDEISVEESR